MKNIKNCSIIGIKKCIAKEIKIIRIPKEKVI